jgi:hypothetical protein
MKRFVLHKHVVAAKQQIMLILILPKSLQTTINSKALFLYSEFFDTAFHYAHK